MIVKHDFIIGIDPGTKTGLAIYCKKTRSLVEVKTLAIHQAFDIVKQYHSTSCIHVRVEDARKRKWFGPNAQVKVQGAGAIKRECKMWESFLEENGILFDMPAPGRSRTKVSKEYFQKLTGYNKLTSNHARDAAMLVWGY